MSYYGREALIWNFLSETGKVYLIVVKRFSEVYPQDLEAVLIVNILCNRLAATTILMLLFKKYQLCILQNLFKQFNNHVEIHLTKYFIYLDTGSVIGYQLLITVSKYFYSVFNRPNVLWNNPILAWTTNILNAYLQWESNSLGSLDL